MGRSQGFLAERGEKKKTSHHSVCVMAKTLLFFSHNLIQLEEGCGVWLINVNDLGNLPVEGWGNVGQSWNETSALGIGSGGEEWALH